MEMNYCYGCMEQINEGQTICPCCGWDNSKRKNDENLLREGTILNAKYLIGRKLGKGGFGVTYLGLDLQLNIKAAIKEYFPKDWCSRAAGSKLVEVLNDVENREKFLKGRNSFWNEAQTLAMFNSSSIAHVQNFFVENNTAYIVMDYVGGVGLDEAIRQCGGRMPWQQVISLSMGLMPELNRLHHQNLVHRDIKPANLKVVEDEDTGKERLVLLDFGAARRYVSAELTGTYSTILTAGYAPFEQYQKRSHQGPYTDVYALCATIYKAITGTVPPAAPDRIGDNPERIIPVSEFGLDVPDAVVQVIMHGLEFKSENRPQTMRELYDEFAAALKEEPDPREEIYQQAVSLLAEDTADSCKQAAELFGQIQGYKDADRQRNICNQKESEFRLKKIYEDAKEKMASERYGEALILFEKIHGYQNADEKAEICRKRIAEMNEPGKPVKKKNKPILLCIILLAAVLGIFAVSITIRKDQKKTNIQKTHAAQTYTAQKTAAKKENATRTPDPDIPDIPWDDPVTPVISLYQQGEKAYQAKNYEEALEYLIPAANAGDPDAQFRLGYMYSIGEGVEPSDEEAVKWYQLAADQGISVAQNNLGSKYYKGEGVGKSYEEAFKWYKKAADQGYAKAQCNLGAMYYNGEGVGKSYEEAVKWYKKAADQGYAKAQYMMGLMYENGEGVDKDPKEAERWYQMAAGQGNESAKKNLKELQEKMNTASTPSAALLKTAAPTPSKSSSGAGNDYSGLKAGDIITFGRYEQDNNLNNGAEPIEWLVLSVKDPDANSFDFFPKALLLSKYALDTLPYHDVAGGITWEKCSLRKWLNDSFYNTAFTESERKLIKMVTNSNPDVKSSYVGVVLGGSNTMDNIFLLSIDEAKDYLSSAGFGKCEATAYAKAKGAYKSSDGKTIWWLRSPGDYSSHASYINWTGSLSSCVAYDKDITVRIALWIDIDRNK